MRIVNTTGNSNDTHVLDENGKDITQELNVVKITIVAGERNRVLLECFDVQLDVVGDKAS